MKLICDTIYLDVAFQTQGLFYWAQF